MNELLPYEEQLAGKMADIPLPGEDKSWDAMRKMLENDDDDNIVPPPVTKGCRGWGMGLVLLLLVAVAVTAYKLMHKTNEPVNSALVAIGNRDSALSFKSDDKLTAKNAGTDTSHLLPNTLTNTTKNELKHDTALTAANSIKTPGVNNGVIKQGEKGKKTGSIAVARKIQPAEKNGTQTISHNTAGKTVTGKKDVTVPGVKNNYSSSPQKPAADSTVMQIDTTRNTTSLPIKPNTATGLLNTGKDSLRTQSSTTNKQPVVKKDRVEHDSNKKAKDDNDGDENDNKVWFGAGIALQQLIPIDGQKAVPYNSFGRKGSLGDYIPSAYFRAYQKRKFLQVEFRYGAPQYTKDIEYSKKILSHDTNTGLTISSVNHVKKTYYHQLPVSIHYNVLPNLSIGAGLVWNKFQNAVVEQQTERSIGGVTTSDSLPGTIINVKKDSANSFAKSYFQFMLETQYRWKRFSFGARYSRGIQPYLTFTSPTTGQTQRERNASLQIFLRYELWRSKKK